MVQFRTARPEDLAEMVALSDRVFRKPHQVSMGKAYSLLFSHENAKHMLIAEEDNRIVSVVGMLPSEVSVAGCKFRVQSMGSVCTDGDYRGKDYAGTLVRMAIETCEREGTHMLLVSGNRTLYRRNGCYEFGMLRYFTVTPPAAEAALASSKSDTLTAQAETVSYDEARDLESMLRLMRQEKTYYVRTKEQFAEQIRGAAVFSNYSMIQHIAIRRSAGEATAYVVFGLPGHDPLRTPEVIEYAGSDRAVMELLNDIVKQYRLEKLTVPVGADRAALGERLAASGARLQCLPNPGTIRLIDMAAIWQSLQPYIRQSVGADRAGEVSCSRLGSGPFRIAFGDDSITLDARGAAALLFNGAPWNAGDSLKPILDRLFPIPFVYTNNLSFV